MTTITKTVQRVTQDTYSCGRNARKLVLAFEAGELITASQLSRLLAHRTEYEDLCFRPWPYGHNEVAFEGFETPV